MTRRPKRLSETPTVHPDARIDESRLGAWTEVGARTTIVESTLDDYSYVVHDSQIIYATIGKFCSIASHTRLNPGNHPMDRASLHHFTYRAFQFDMGEDDLDFFDWRRDAAVTLGHDVWIGHGAIVLPGVSIGTGAVIGAGSIVTKDVAPYTIVVGNPARPMRPRFPDAVQQGFMDLAWWDWPHDKLKAALPDFRILSAEDFVAKYGGERPV